MNSFIKSVKKNSYATKWEELEKNKKLSSVYKQIKHVEYSEFKAKILEQSPEFVNSVVESLYSGDMYIIKNALDQKKVNYIIEEIHKFNQSSPSTFYKMLEGVPNFHRWIGKDLINSYTIKYTKHSTHMFPWNEDIADVRKIIMEICRPLKLLAGLSLFEFENDTPKDLIVERLQIARYPPTGFIEPHIDANTLMRLVISGYLSTRGIDYHEGGFYFMDKEDNKCDVENKIKAGDIGLFYASLRHGMDVIDPKKKADIVKKDGRWWFGLNVHNSNEIEDSKRQTTTPYKLNKNI
ncbi:hypothetical protein OAL70_01700 [Pelagibacteraceae bacterium]|nr:hypothetical protein [Pelagibacteraceae bacterium]